MISMMALGQSNQSTIAAPHAVRFFIPTILMMTVMTVSDLRINFSYDCPPIADRRWDYSATVDGYEPGDPVGHGATKDEAKLDLLEQLFVYSPAPQPSGQVVASVLPLGLRSIATELLQCFEAWEPGVRVMGNVQARDGADLMRAILNAPSPAAVEAADMDKLLAAHKLMPAVDRDRFSLSMLHSLYIALQKLSFAAQITGGTAGRDEDLCEAIAHAEIVLNESKPTVGVDTADRYAVRFVNNWDGEGDICYALAIKNDDGDFIDADFLKPLLGYVGDKILNVWPLVIKPAAVEPLNNGEPLQGDSFGSEWIKPAAESGTKEHAHEWRDTQSYSGNYKFQVCDRCGDKRPLCAVESGGDEYRLLCVGETIQVCDEFLQDDDWSWRPLTESGGIAIGVPFTQGMLPCRRPKTPAPTAAQQPSDKP
jgi:hypothetical protein